MNDPTPTPTSAPTMKPTTAPTMTPTFSFDTEVNKKARKHYQSIQAQNIIENGGFTEGLSTDKWKCANTLDPGYLMPPTAITGWTIKGEVCRIKAGRMEWGYPTAISGSYITSLHVGIPKEALAIDIAAGKYEATLSQTADTVPGDSYTLSWYEMKRRHYEWQPAELRITANGVVLADHRIKKPTRRLQKPRHWIMDWTQRNVTFTADSASTTIKFIADPARTADVLLDGISLSASAPTMKPTTAPTMKPTTAPTMKPTTTMKCQDDPDYTFDIKADMRIDYDSKNGYPFGNPSWAYDKSWDGRLPWKTAKIPCSELHAKLSVGTWVSKDCKWYTNYHTGDLQWLRMIKNCPVTCNACGYDFSAPTPAPTPMVWDDDTYNDDYRLRR